MKHILNNVALAKKADVAWQCLAFIAMIFAVSCTRLYLFGLYVMAAAQSLSSIFWAIYFAVGDCPQYKAGKLIRTVFITTSVLLLLSLLAEWEFFFGISIFMAILGPLLGIAYFVITLKEAGYYSKARKPFYLI